MGDRNRLARVGYQAVVLAAVGVLAVSQPMPVAASVLTEPLWVTDFDGKGRIWDEARAVTVSPDGSVAFVTGVSWSGASLNDMMTFAYDTGSGEPVWMARYDGPHHNNDYGVGIVTDGSRVYVIGTSWTNLQSGEDFVTIAYDAATGAELWQTRYDQGPYDSATSVSLASVGADLYVTGASYDPSSPGMTDYATLRYDASTGSQIWVARFDGTIGAQDYPNKVQVNPIGSAVYVTGVTYGGAGGDYGTVAYGTSTGQELWRSLESGSNVGGPDYANSLAVSPDGSSVFVAGWFDNGVTAYDYATVAYDAASGSRLWLSEYDGREHYYDAVSALGLSPDGEQVYVTGYSYRSSGDDFVTISYSAAAGDPLWLSRFTALGTENPTALAVGTDGTIYIAGVTYNPNVYGGDWITVSLDGVTGSRLWKALEVHSGNEYPYGIAVDPGGSRVFETGVVQATPDGRTDYRTLAYAT